MRAWSRCPSSICPRSFKEEPPRRRCATRSIWRSAPRRGAIGVSGSPSITTCRGLRVRMWLLGSSLFSAQLAAELGLPFAFASHFAPDHLIDALTVYRTRFKPSATQPAPYAMAGAGIFAADTDAEARRLFTSAQQ